MYAHWQITSSFTGRSIAHSLHTVSKHEDEGGFKTVLHKPVSDVTAPFIVYTSGPQPFFTPQFNARQYFHGPATKVSR